MQRDYKEEETWEEEFNLFKVQNQCMQKRILRGFQIVKSLQGARRTSDDLGTHIEDIKDTGNALFNQGCLGQAEQKYDECIACLKSQLLKRTE